MKRRRRFPLGFLIEFSNFCQWKETKELKNGKSNYNAKYGHKNLYRNDEMKLLTWLLDICSFLDKSFLSS